MNILVTGAKGMVGTALCNNLKNIRDGKNKTRPALDIKEIYEYDLDSTPAELDEYCQKADFVFNLAGVNRPENPEDFMKGNFGFASDLLNCLKKHNNKATIMLSSSIQATLAGRFGNSEYGRSKKAGEELFFQYAQETGAKVAVYRFVNLMGHSRPKYNSAVSTFCWAVANDEPFTVNDRSTELELLYIDDLVEGMFDLLEGKEQHCEFDGVETVLKADGRYCCVPVTHKVTLGRDRGSAAGVQGTAHDPHDAQDAGRLLCQETVLPVPDLFAHRQVQVCPENERGQPWLLYGAGTHCRLRSGEHQHQPPRYHQGAALAQL